MERAYQICTRCIMDTTDPDIVFDENGVCNHCTLYFKRVQNEVPSESERAARRDALVAAIKEAGKGKEYDCIIGVSGGVDSTFVAYSVKKLGLRPLAVHLDNGWNSELAVDNIKRALDRLGIELYTHVLDWEEFRDIQLSFLKASVANCEIPTDHAINALLFRVASQNGIRFVLGGGNLQTEAILPLSWGYYNYDLRHLKAVHRKFGTVPMRDFPQLGMMKYFYYVFVKKMRVVSILNYLDYNKTKAMEVIQEELGWRPYGGKHYESIYTRFFQGYILPKKFGYDKRRAHLSTLVCSGEMSREAALAEMERDPYADNNLKEDMQFVVKKLGMTCEQFEELMRAPVKTYRDYPSNAEIYHRLSNMKALFKRIATRV